MIFLTTEQVIHLHELLLAQSGGLSGIRDRGLLESAVSQPQATFSGHELCPTLHEKASTLAFSLARNHAFFDGNKRIAHAAMETFLILNGFQIECGVDEQERVFLQLAEGTLTREALTLWVQSHLVPLTLGE